MSGAPVLVEGPLTSDLVARALVASAQLLGFDPATLFEPVQDGRGRARTVAGAALLHPTCRPAKACGRVTGVHPNTLSPSGLVKRGVTAEQVGAVRSVIFAAPIPSGPDIVRPGDVPKRLDNWVNPRRDMEREARVIAARERGIGPQAISHAEGIGTTAIHRILKRSGKTFPPLKTGPHGPTGPKKPRAKAAPRVLKPAPPPPPPPPPAPKPFPRDHAAWAPLPGSEPVRLIDHRSGCRWPVEVEGARSAMVCNLKPHAGHAYCSRHRWLSVSPAARSGETKVPAVQPPRVARSADTDIAALKEEAA